MLQSAPEAPAASPATAANPQQQVTRVYNQGPPVGGGRGGRNLKHKQTKTLTIQCQNP